MDQPVPELDASAETKLMAYAFPGNVRELENILERAMAMCAGDTIGAEDIRIRETSAADEETDSGDLGERLESVERDAIVQALEATRYNKTAAARKLGLSLRALRYRIQKLGIE